MENRYVAARRQALWEILRSSATNEEKLETLAATGEQERRRAYGRGYWDARRPSALRAGKLRPVAGEGRA
jgi:hypothetical protein